MSSNGEAKLSIDRFETLALVHIDSVYRLALYMAGNEDDAQRLVRNTYLKAYRSFSRFEAGTICKAWLLGILNDKLSNAIGHGSDEVSKDRFGDDIIAAIDELPAQYRIAVLLADVEGLSYKEIADVIDCPIGTVMSRLCSGRRLLGKGLQDRQFSGTRESGELNMAITAEEIE